MQLAQSWGRDPESEAFPRVQVRIINEITNLDHHHVMCLGLVVTRTWFLSNVHLPYCTNLLQKLSEIKAEILYLPRSPTP